MMGFPGDADGRESACNARDLGLIPELGRPPGGELGNPLQYSCLENPYGQRSLIGYSPWDHKELDMAKHSTAHDIHFFFGGRRYSLVSQLVKNPPALQETLVQFLSQEDLLEKG